METTNIKPTREPLKPFSEEAKSLQEGTLYMHYSGKRYQVLSVGRHSENLEECVVYKALYGEQDIWIRPLAMFLETVEVDGKVQSRFKRLNEK